MLSANDTGIGGFKEVIFLVKGKGAYSRLKFESGVHRVQRVPVTESSGRIHTSTATVVVLPEVEDVEVQIPEKDIEIEVYRSAGAGGQNVQKNSTAVRIRHLPTGHRGAVPGRAQPIAEQTARHVHSARAAVRHGARQARIRNITDARHSQVGSAERSEKIRTYNFPQARITDHRIDKSVFGPRMTAMLDGDLDEFIDELATRDQAERLQAAGLDG